MKPDPDNNNHGLLVLGLPSPQSTVRTRPRNRKSKRNATVRVVSPYFSEKKEKDVVRGLLVRSRNPCPSGEGDLLNPHPTGFLRVSKYFQKHMAVAKHEPVSGTTSLFQFDGNSIGIEKTPQRILQLSACDSELLPHCKIAVEDNGFEEKKMVPQLPVPDVKNDYIGKKKDKNRNKAKCDQAVENETKVELLNKKKRRRKDNDCEEKKGVLKNEDHVLQPPLDDSPSVVLEANNHKVVTSVPPRKVSPYFDTDNAGENISCCDIQKTAKHAQLLQDVSPCFPTSGADYQGTRKTDYFEKETDKKMKKRRKLACYEDKEMTPLKKVKKRAAHEQHCQEAQAENEDSVQGPQHATSPCSVVTTASAGLQDVPSPLLCKATRKVSPYFHNIPEKGDQRVKLGAERASGTICINIDEVLSKFVYKSKREMIKVVSEDFAREPERRRKRSKKPASRTLNAKEMFSEAYRRKAPDDTWVPPSYRPKLLQEDHAHDPWRVLVICMLLNVTTGAQVKKVLPYFFSLYPDANAASTADLRTMRSLIQSLGLVDIRTKKIKAMSKRYLENDWTHVTQLPGVGKYAADAHAIFCTGMWAQVTPEDHKLTDYWNFLKERAEKIGK